MCLLYVAPRDSMHPLKLLLSHLHPLVEVELVIVKLGFSTVQQTSK